MSRTLFPPMHTGLSLSSSLSQGLPQSLALDLAASPHDDLTLKGPAQQTGGPLNSWIPIPDPNGRRFFYNPQTQQSQWELYC